MPVVYCRFSKFVRKCTLYIVSFIENGKYVRVSRGHKGNQHVSAAKPDTGRDKLLEVNPEDITLIRCVCMWLQEE